MATYEDMKLVTTRFGHIDPGENWTDFSRSFADSNTPFGVRTIPSIEALANTAAHIITSAEGRSFPTEEEFEDVASRFGKLVVPPFTRFESDLFMSAATATYVSNANFVPGATA